MIRHAREADEPTVRAIVLAAYQHYVPMIGAMPGPMLDDYAMRIAADQVWIAEAGGSIAGVVVLQDGPDHFLLDNIAVLPDRQGNGIGRTLLDFAETEAARRGWTTITLYTNALMTENIAIYARRGYVVRDRRTEKGFDRVYMEKPLCPSCAEGL